MEPLCVTKKRKKEKKRRHLSFVLPISIPSYPMNARKNAKIHVYLGGSDGWQKSPFQIAMKEVQKISYSWCNLDVEYLCLSKIREKEWSIVNLVDWILDSDFHFVLSHVHQSVVEFDCTEVVCELQRLRGHKGFPQGEELLCSMFLQDKRVYIEGTFHLYF